MAGDVRRKGPVARSAPPWRATPFKVRRQSHSVLGGPSRAYNGLEMSRLAGEGRAAWAENGYAGSVRSAKDQTHVKDTLACRPESIGL
jgi:hypothetical protein